MIDIRRKSKAAVLAALYNRATPTGVHLPNFSDVPMTEANAKVFLESHTDFYYLNGRALMVNLDSNLFFNEKKYDEIYGKGAAQKAVDSCVDIR